MSIHTECMCVDVFKCKRVWIVLLLNIQYDTTLEVLQCWHYCMFHFTIQTSEALPQPITSCDFSFNGNLFAYAASYDWSKVSVCICMYIQVSI